MSWRNQVKYPPKNLHRSVRDQVVQHQEAVAPRLRRKHQEAVPGRCPAANHTFAVGDTYYLPPINISTFATDAGDAVEGIEVGAVSTLLDAPPGFLIDPRNGLVGGASNVEGGPYATSLVAIDPKGNSAIPSRIHLPRLWSPANPVFPPFFARVQTSTRSCIYSRFAGQRRSNIQEKVIFW